MADPALRQHLEARSFISAPGVYDLISALIADRMGFKALYVTGYGTVASSLGLPDAGLATYTEMIERIGRIAQMAKTPVIADADTGYGGLLNVRHTVRGYEKAGVSAIQIEDQEFPKKCGHTPNRRVVPMEDMVRKIRVASDSRSSADFLIIARTDARTSLGSRRGDPARRGLWRGGCGHRLHRVAGDRGRDGRDRPAHRQAADRQHGPWRPYAHAPGVAPRRRSATPPRSSPRSVSSPPRRR